MTGNQMVERDERTTAVEEASYGLGYKLVAYALLLDVMYRSLVHGEAAWDLMAIVILSGAAITGYQWRRQILSRRWVRSIALILVLSALTAAVTVAVLLRLK